MKHFKLILNTAGNDLDLIKGCEPLVDYCSCDGEGDISCQSIIGDIECPDTEVCNCDGEGDTGCLSEETGDCVNTEVCNCDGESGCFLIETNCILIDTGDCSDTDSECFLIDICVSDGVCSNNDY